MYGLESFLVKDSPGTFSHLGENLLFKSIVLSSLIQDRSSLKEKELELAVILYTSTCSVPEDSSK